MEKIKLTNICTPKQWKTIPTSELLSIGYPVYGANGIIGYYNTYNHEQAVITITCRGASCGTINITKPKSYITGNAMCLDNVREDINLNYLYFNLLFYDFNKVISGSAQPQITRQGLEKVEISICPQTEQISIVSILKTIESLILARKKELKYLDELVKARFVEMFGDPKTNHKNYPVKKIRDTCLVITGNTPSRKVSEYYGDLIEWIKTDNIVPNMLNPTRAAEFLSERGKTIGRTVNAEAILMVCIAGSIASIGRVCITDREVAFNQQINAIIPKLYNVRFLYSLLQNSKDYLVEDINMSLKGIVSKSKLEEKIFILPPIVEQIRFAEFASLVDKSKFVSHLN